MADIDIDHLRSWIGRKEQAEDVVTWRPAAALAATLDYATLPKVGDALPPLWHWVYFTPLARQSELREDGHRRLGDFMPPIPLPRRMRAGGRFKFFDSLRIGDQVTCETEITDVTAKVGRQGALVFITLLRRYLTARGPAIEEVESAVYREAVTGAPKASKPEAVALERAPADWRDPITATPSFLFRYSALTFNSHRIHYDAPYAREQEGYPGLVVHGPLTATLLLERLAAHVPGTVREFSFRGELPLFAGDEFSLCGRKEADGGYALWAETPTGAPAMTGSARIEN